MVRIGEWITLKGSKSVYEVTLINYLDRRISIKPVSGSLKEMGHLLISFEDLSSCTILGNPNENQSLRLLYG